MQTRRLGRLWLAASFVLMALAVLVPNSTYPLLTLVSLLGATAAGYLALMRRTVLWLALIALVAACVVWAGPGELTTNGIQWLSAALVLIIATAAVIYYVRVLEERLFEASWQAEISSEAADLGVFRWEFETNRLHASPKLRELLLLPTEGAVYADDVFRKIHEDDLDQVRRAIEGARSSSGPFRSEFRVGDGEGRFRWISGRGRVIVDPRSGALSLAGVNYDITDLKERESLVSKLIDGIGAVFSIMTPDGEILDLNEYGETVSGKTEEEWKGKEFWELQMWGRSEDTRATVQHLIERAGEEGQVTGEAPFWDEEGDKGWALITVTPILSDFGEPLHLCLCAVDISKRKAAEESNDLLVHELNHRIKNLFSVTNALISLSARYAVTVDEFADATRRRLFALHEAHNIGAGDLKKRSADLREILEVTLRPWRMKPQRIFINGESKIFDAGAATAWALIAHELASNAAKYGCLRDAGGKLTIDWRENDEEFVFQWREENNTPMTESGDEAEGFGKNIIHRLVDGFLSGEIERDITEEGASVSIRMPKAA
ncbi:PAS domain S-box protein [Marinicaulis aureus]|uniref:histidine kinase n=1 Tax=Hyphococcus aureus TaxID=2666033 RepID=A0ABW1KUQ8_9PROT